MKILTVVTGMLAENTYIIAADGSREAVVIDPGDYPLDITRAIGHAGLTPTHILITHGHYDHVGALNDIRSKYGARVAIHEKDATMLTDRTRDIGPFPGARMAEKPADIILQDGDAIRAAGLEIKVMHTPGHSPGGVCFIVEDSIFSGDTLFAQGIGRTDFPESNRDDMHDSLNRLCALEGNYNVYPGHGPATTLDAERQPDPFLRG